MAAIFPDARDFRFRDINVFPAPALEALKELEPRIAAGAIYDSAERCDAPKCHPETRNAVQNDLYDWILDGDGSSGSPGKIMWVTGPAGSGKTAIMGSLADRCAANGFLGASFFFASWSTSGRRHKTFFVTTIAHQLAQHRDDLQTAISVAIQKNRGIFEKNIHVQMEVLVLSPLREVISRSDRSPLRGSIIIDGLDECEAEQYHDASIAGRHPGRRGRPERTNAEDQLEILQVLQVAASDPLFPFRILIASRPERVFRDFFDSEKNPSVLAKKLDLHEVYNADADIALFLEAEFSRLGRRYNLPPSWIPPGAVATLVYKASGQFIYAATVIRFLDTDHRQAPKALLEAILKMEAVATSNPLEELDELYLHILNSSPDPPLSALWICSISGCLPIHDSPASNVQALLQTDPASNEAEHLLGKLHSLIRIPPLRDQATTQYTFYHKSLLDFLNDPERSGNLYVEDREVKLFVWNAFVRACASEFFIML
ncbi:hypothetical protein MD484_g4439, partial [Candolleomyces efflorescens]